MLLMRRKRGVRGATYYRGRWGSLVTGKSLALKKVCYSEVMWDLTGFFICELVTIKKGFYLELRLLILIHTLPWRFTFLYLPLLRKHIILFLRNFIYLLMLRIIRTSMRINIMRFQVLSIDNSSMCWICVSISILAESRFSKVGLKRCVCQPSCLLFEFL